MNYFPILLTIIVYANINFVNCDGPTSRILYGTHVRIENYPYYAGLHNCGAAILSDRWILTAAHCVEDRSQVQHYRRSRTYGHVWVGGETFQNSRAVPYDKVIIHNEYHSISKIPIHDVAVIRLATLLQFSSKIQPISLPRSDFSRNSNAVFVGRGRDESGRMATRLRKIDVVTLTTDQCINQIPQQYQSFARYHQSLFEKNNICARRRENMPGVCKGDSGSPLAIGKTVIGLASYIGTQCHQARLGFYVNVFTYVPWIKSVTGL